MIITINNQKTTINRFLVYALIFYICKTASLYVVSKKSKRDFYLVDFSIPLCKVDTV